VNAIALVAAVLHTCWLAGVGTATGVGFTNIVVVCGAPAQLLATGVTVILAVTRAVVVLVAIKLLIAFVPVAARLMDVLSLVHV
jgi:hypothetical protein